MVFLICCAPLLYSSYHERCCCYSLWISCLLAFSSVWDILNVSSLVRWYERHRQFPSRRSWEFRWHKVSSRAPIHISQKQTFFVFTLLIFSCMYYHSFSNSCSIPHLCPWGQESTGGQTDQDTYGRRWMSESAIECPGLCSYLKAGKYKWLPLHRSAEQNKNWVGRDTSGSSHLKQNEQVDEREQQEQCYLFSLLAGVSGALLLYYQLQVQLNPINIGFLMWSRSLFSDVGHGDISKLTAICRAAERTKDGWEIQCRMFMVLQNLLSKVRIYPHTRNL